MTVVEQVLRSRARVAAGHRLVIIEPCEDGGRRDAGRQHTHGQILLVVFLRAHLVTGQHGGRPVFVLEVRRIDEFHAATHLEAVDLRIIGIVVHLVGPGVAGQRGRIVDRTARRIDIKVYAAVQRQSALVGLGAQQFVLDAEVRGQTVGFFAVRSLIGNGHGVAKTPDGCQLIAGEVTILGIDTAGTGVHDVVFISIRAVGILAEDAHVGRHLLGQAEDVVTVVTVVARVGQGKVRGEADAVAHVVVEHQARGELLELLFDDGTRLVLVTGGDAEGSLLTTTREVQVVLMLSAELCHGVHPVGIVVPVLILRPCGVIVQLLDVRGGIGFLGRIVEGLLHQHGVAVTVEQLVALRLPGAGELIGEIQAGFSTHTVLRRNEQHTIGALRAPYGGGGSILQHDNVGDIVHVDRQQRGILFLVGIGEVEVLVRVVENLVVHHNQRVGIAGDGGDTTQTHLRTGTQVTRVGHNVQTGNLTLQGLVGRGECQTFDVLHVQCLLRHGDFLLRDHQTAGIAALGLDDHLLQLCILSLQLDIEHRAVADAYNLSLVSHIREHQLVLSALNLHGEVTVEVGLHGRNDTVVGIALHNVGHHNRTVVVGQRTRNTDTLRHQWQADDAQQGRK